ncbi:MAG: beta-L-arabinofuranosidase domain-containing protein [Terriglobales bacterium]
MISRPPLAEFGYGDVTLTSELHEQQLAETHAVLMQLSEDSLLKPLRQMSGQPAPGEDLGGWYYFDPKYRLGPGWVGFAPSCTFGQWVSALARTYAITGDPATRDKVLRLNRLYAKTISGDYYERNRFPTYCYDKLVCGLIDSHQFAGDPDAFSILERTTDTALSHFPKEAVEHGTPWRPNKDETWTWDESYTISENLFLAYQRGAGVRYRDLGLQYLDNQYYDPLAEGRNNLAGRHAYSHVNSLSSAMQAYLTLGSEKHLRAARNAFEMLSAQSFATGGWGPDERLPAPGSDDISASLTGTHSSFETPCGSYAHFKLTRYLLRVTRDSQYGDSMERVMYNTVLGAKPLLADGHNFYYSDYNFKGHKLYKEVGWTCCSGTLPQVAADYRINTYFRDPDGIYVNLYIPSTLRYQKNGAKVSLRQKSTYPSDGLVQFDVIASKQSEFAVRFRIPKWAEGASISVNGARVAAAVIPGTFASIRRRWKTGDRVEVNLPMTLRLQPVDPQHSGVVALLRGPLVLFAITEAAPTVTRRQLLAAKKTGAQTWQVETDTGQMKMLPFTAIADEQYSTYLQVS